jgi:hypothetical protein
VPEAVNAKATGQVAFLLRAGNVYVMTRRTQSAIGKFSTRSDDSLIEVKHHTDAMVQTHMKRSIEGGLIVINKILLAALCVAGVAAAGCSTQGQVNPDVMQVATTPLTCSDGAQCDLWWQRAQTWVQNHSTYKIESATRSLIQTAGPDGGKRALAYQITRTANPDGTATIGFAAHCDGSMGCKPNPWEAGADFKEFVRGQSGAGANAPQGNATPSQPATTTAHPDASQGQSIPAANGEAMSQ